MDLDWSRIFAVNTSLLELIVRGTVMYFFSSSCSGSSSAGASGRWGWPTS